MSAPLVVDGLAVALLALAFAGVLEHDLRTGVRLLVAQAILLALVAATLAIDSGAPHLWIAAALTVAVRVVAVPAIFFAVLRAVGQRRESDPVISTRTAIAAALLLVAVAFGAAARLELPDAFPAHQALPVALALALVGVLLMATRRMVVSQLIGLVTLENGVFLAGLVATSGLPLFVELGVFFDLLVAVAVTAVLALGIHEHFYSLSTEHLRRLRG
jgi:hydrogenase-4 component E